MFWPVQAIEIIILLMFTHQPTLAKVNVFSILLEIISFRTVKILAGDFNCIESEKDKFGGNFASANELKGLRRNSRLVDIWRKHTAILFNVLGLMWLNLLVLG